MNKRRILTILLSLVGMAGCITVQADVVNDLYEAEMPVVSQDRQERDLTMREALANVLVRVSGREAARAIAQDEALVPRPTQYIQQFRYTQFAPNEVIPPQPDGSKPYTQKLWMRFGEKRLENLLLDQGLPVWGKTRPATLVWLVVDDQKQRFLLGNSTPHEVQAYLQQAAKQRGLPLRLPFLDLADQAKLRVTDVWGNFEDTILDASTRYQADAVLVGRIYLSYAHTWHARWTLYSGGQRQDWETEGNPNLQTAVASAMMQTGEALSIRFAQLKDNQASNTVLVQVKDIHDLTQYNRAVDYLQSLNIVTEVQPSRVSRDEVTFNVTSHSGRLGISQAIALGHVLIADNSGVPVVTLPGPADPNVPPPLQADLVYRLIP